MSRKLLMPKKIFYNCFPHNYLLSLTGVARYIGNAWYILVAAFCDLMISCLEFLVSTNSNNTFIVQYRQYIVHCVTILFVNYFFYCSLYGVHYSVYTVHCTLYNVHWTVVTQKCDKTQKKTQSETKLRMWQSSKTQKVTIIKNSKLDKTQNFQMWKNSTTQNVTKLKLWQNLNNQNLTKL